MSSLPTKLLEDAKVHSMLHVSLLKKKIGKDMNPKPKLPLFRLKETL